MLNVLNEDLYDCKFISKCFFMYLIQNLLNFRYFEAYMMLYDKEKNFFQVDSVRNLIDSLIFF